MSEKMSLKQNIALIIRGLKYFKHMPLPLVLPKTLKAAATAATPFVNLFFSAMILNELAGARDQSRLVNLVILTIGLNLGAVILRSIAFRWENYCCSYNYHSVFKFMSDKSLSMDFADVEDESVRDQYAKFFQHHGGTGWGFSVLYETYEPLILQSVRVVIALFMMGGIFAATVPYGSPLPWLNTAFATAALVALVAAAALIGPVINFITGRNPIDTAETNARGIRIYNHYIIKMTEASAKVKDIQMYDQKRLIDKGLSEFDFYKIWEPNYKRWIKAGMWRTSITYFFNAFIFLFVALYAYGGAFGVGSIVLYVGLITQFSNGFGSLLGSITFLFRNNPFLAKVFEYLDIPNKLGRGTLPIDKHTDIEIEFCNVGFKYPGTETYALKNVNFKFTPGRRLAVVGQNGSGKTTMIKLLCRLYDPTEGKITLNGVDIRDYDYHSYMTIFSVVFQDFNLLPFTLGQNVAAGTNFDPVKAADALIQVSFGERLDSMPTKLDTYLYKNFEQEGITISGGEAQKIALARALYRDAPFIVLDEPTAALDPIAEAEIYAKFNELVGDRSAVYISHRLSSCRFCDDIAVFHQGQLTQFGNHDSLITDENGKYHELWHAQAQYYD